MDMNEIIKKAQEVQAKIEESKAKLSSLAVAGQAGVEPDTVKILMNGHYEAKKVAISPSLLKHHTEEAREILQDLVAAAINDAVHKIGNAGRNTLMDAFSGMQMPEGFKWPTDQQ